MPMATASGNASSSDTVKATGGPTPLHTDLGCTIDWLRPGRTAPDMCVLSGAVCCVVVTENWVRAREHAMCGVHSRMCLHVCGVIVCGDQGRIVRPCAGQNHAIVSRITLYYTSLATL